MSLRSSRAAIDLIIASEVTDRASYERRLMRPTWPGGASGVTVAIGYDLGFATADSIASDWGPRLPASAITAMKSVMGKTGEDARAAVASVRQAISVPWDAAVEVFMVHDMPKWERIVLRAVPGAEKLPAGCFGVLVSLAFNRGASFSKDGDRYREMRDIRMHVVSGQWDLVPDDIRSMKRLWPSPSQRGLPIRRDAEADLWDKSLHAAFQNGYTEQRDTGDDPTDPDVTQEGNEVAPPTHGPNYDPVVEAIQKKLTEMNYHEVGAIDGEVGGKLKGAIAAFMNDRGKEPIGKVTAEFRAELSKAVNERWTRPIADRRANATAKDIAPKVASVNQLWYQKLFAYIIGAPAFLTAGFKTVFGDQGSPSGYIEAIKNFFGMIPPEFYWAAVGGLAIAIFIQAKRAQDATVKAYQRGEIN